MLEIGTHQVLEVARLTPIGAVLRNIYGDEVLLPGKYLPEGTVAGTGLEVFLYKDHEHRPIATTLEPLVTLNKIALLRVKAVSDHGAFLSWGVEKDLFVPFREQVGKMRAGEDHLVILYLDDRTDRLAASANLHRFLDNEAISVADGEEVELVIWDKTDLGYNVIVNYLHKGLIYDNEIFSPIKTGDVRKGYVKQVRPDKKLDITLNKPGYEGVEPNAEKIMNMLQANSGFLPYTDKSDPQEISSNFEMSKKTFKKALGTLYKQRMVRLEEDGIYLA